MKIGTDGVLLGAWVPLAGDLRGVLDVGAGSGVVSLIVAQRTAGRPYINIGGIELDAAASEDARENFAASPWAGRLTLAEGDFLEADMRLPHPLVIVSNPPFFNEPLRSPDTKRALARHGEGLTVESLIRRADGLLTHPSDRLAFVAPASRDEEIEYLLFRSRFYPSERVRVLPAPGREPLRTLWLAQRALTRCKVSDLPVRERDGSYSAAYRALTEELYVKL